MSKNLTRKGLALGAVVALGSSLFAGAPAFAAAGINLNDVNSKGIYGMLEGEAFTLLAAGNADFNASNASSLKVQVKNLDGADASGYQIGLNAGALTTLTSSNDVDTTSSSTDEDVATTAGSMGVFAIEGTSDGVSGMVSPFKFSFTVASVTAGTNARFEVKAWADVDNDGVIDTDSTNGNTPEIVSATRTVQFFDISEVTTSTTISTVYEGDTAVTAKTSFTNIAGDQLAAESLVAKFTDGTGTALPGYDGTTLVPDVFASYSSTTGLWTSTTTGEIDSVNDSDVDGIAKDTAVKVAFAFDADGDDSADTTVDGDEAAFAAGTSATLSVVSRTVDSFVADAVKSDNAAVDGDANGVADVKLNGSFKLGVTAKASTKAVAGVPVTAAVTVSGATLGSTVKVTVNGVTYDADSKLPGYSNDTVAKLNLGNTDANGQVFVTVSTVGFTEGQDVTVTFYAQNYSDAITANGADSVFKAYLLNAVDAISTTDGAAVNLNWVVRDQYGAKPANNVYEINSDFVSSGQTTAATDATEGYVAVVDGAATLSITDNGTGTGDNLYDIFLSKKATNGGYASSNQVRQDFAVQIVSAAALTAGTITESDASLDTDTQIYTESVTSTAADLALIDFFAHDSRTATVAAPAAPATAVGATIAGTVTTKASATAAAELIDGAQVTIAGAGLLFKSTIAAVNGNAGGGDSDTTDVGDASAQTVYGVGSLTIPTNGSGAYSFTVFSNKSGKQTVTITSGAASRKVVISEFDAAADTSGTSVSFLSTPEKIAAGRTLTISGLVADKYGNAVNTVSTTDTSNDTAAETLGDFAFVYDGPGYLMNSEPTETDANGAFKVRVLLGTGETGAITVTAKYDANGDLDYADTGDIVVTKTILVGVSASVSAGSKKANVVVKNASGLTVKVVSGTKSTTKVATSDSYKLSLSKLTSGSKTVKVYVQGVLVASKKVSVKR